ncbi:hypothetical protein [Peribacillus muralis]|uniref:hypothetical protein n=1 Tax=Peribacillus muralis TaxID=264697 RepID=UPI00070AE54F|nr:hypothetical protein [Peribacillus muralis]MCK1991327.1 hypothetical protein [Peribacillus muralis]MCK2011881.1 hypothetical protein [Peribacillus muralis]
MKNFFKILCVLTISVALSGCLYPEKQKMQNQLPYKEQMQSVQSAVDQFQKDEGGILPIVTKDAETPIYQKYVIKFSKISPRYMAESPENAYESGGIFQYVLVDVENDPTVKLLDVRMAQKIQEVSLRLTAYQQSNGYPPFKERLSDNVFTLDHEKMGLKEAPTVTSPFSQRDLYLVVDGQGNIFVDYTPDLLEALKGHEAEIKPGDDIRELLVQNSEFVPAYSLPYTIDAKTNNPVFLTK